MAEECIFCQIVAGEAEASVAYEDDATVAFMDLRQTNAGHTLVVPRRHIRDIYELDDDTAAAVIAATSRGSKALYRAWAMLFIIVRKKGKEKFVRWSSVKF